MKAKNDLHKLSNESSFSFCGNPYVTKVAVQFERCRRSGNDLPFKKDSAQPLRHIRGSCYVELLYYYVLVCHLFLVRNWMIIKGRKWTFSEALWSTAVCIVLRQY